MRGGKVHYRDKHFYAESPKIRKGDLFYCGKIYITRNLPFIFLQFSGIRCEKGEFIFH